jgi:putative transposase
MILLKWLDDQLVGGSMSDVYQSLAHSKWDCKYHIVFVPKRRRKTIFGNIRRQLGPVFHALAKQKECQIVEAT